MLNNVFNIQWATVYIHISNPDIQDYSLYLTLNAPPL